ncbi:selenocysteine insertion sequence-binding protein 2-like isoform X1 [Mytilus californianus]|uniref:selenocysteine insertion sequence-binding protein 2-like isoform X1 n=1 Tax=Mytilus californianus TaxID=6549 RepID=UPI002247E4E2|nr:selenocysteine insertion sequence-binding protein 2-like isoform X1 [Mytilus californianus]
MAQSVNFTMDPQGNGHAAGLSANAAVFIPRNYGPPIPPLQTIPTYMTNCFPFVQPDFNGNRLGGNHGNWSRQHRPNRFGNRNNSGHHGNRFPTPNKFSEPPLFPFTSPPPQDPYFNQFMPPPNNFLINNMTSLPVMPSDGESGFENDINSNNFSSNSRRRRNQRDKNSNNINNNIWRSNESIGTDDSGRKTDSSNRQRRRTNSGKKGGSKKDSPRAPVLVLYEREVQTDFSENFAYKTLEEHPSSLYRKSHRRNMRQNDNRERDINSDSGYSSPLHKRNQITIGTQSDSTLSWKLTSNSIQSDDPSIVHAATVPQQKFSYAFIAQKEPSPRPVINQDNQKSAESVRTGQQKSSNNQNKGKPSSGNHGNRSHDSQLANRNTSNTYDLNNQHINKHANKKSEVSDKFQGDIQTKRNQVRKTGQTNSDEETRGFSRKGTTSLDENDYGFSRTKNLRLDKQGERKQSHESNFNKNILKEDKKKENGENLENEFIGNEAAGESGAQGKKKRRRRRKRKKKSTDDPADSQDEADLEPKQEVELHFEDVEEFPDLSSAKALSNKSSAVGISYSAILQTVPVSRPSTVERNKTSSSEDSPRKDNSSLEDKGTRASRRRRKRKDILNTAAENELAEIGLEQQMLKEQCLKTQGQKSHKDEKGQTPGILKVNPKAQNSGKKSKQNVSLDLGAVIDALEQKKTISLTSGARTEQKVKAEQPKNKEEQKSKGSHNVLDASAPIKRGKERETPKAKKPSPLKKVILKEREEKKHLKMLEGTESGSTEAAVGIGVVSAESDLSQDAMSTKSSIDYTGTPGSANLSPVSQTSPISMSPLSPGTSPLSSEVNSPIAGAVGKDVVKKIHSRRFREYCNQVLDKDIDECATTLLQDLVRFQDRMYHKDPSKAKLKRRLVLGLREVAKHLKLRKIKCVIISPNLEKIQSKGGLDDALNNILTLCNEQNVPFVFALGRRALGRACAKMVPVSVVGIFNYSGSEENFKQLIDLTAKARESYGEMVAAIEIEIKEYPMKKQQPTIPHVFAHMGHSRTPSGASVLSFTSSILSEPISENYPHSEPETDSKGYEIVKDDALIKQGLPTDSSGYQTQMRIIHSNTKNNDDDGNEADNEEEGDRINKNSLRKSEENLSLDASALPHIDSIHSGPHDLNTEILSQHSGRTLENCEAMSTHSSRTLGDGSSTILADFGDRSKHGTPKSTESPSNTLQRGKVVDEERIQHWVDETSSRLENLALEEESYEDSTDEMTESDESDEKYNFEMHNEDNKKKIIDYSAGDTENKNNELPENSKKLCDSKTDMEKVSEKLQKIASDSCDGEQINSNAIPSSCDIVNSSDNSMVEIETDSKNCSEKSDIEDSNPLSENSNMADCKINTEKASTDISTGDAIKSSDQLNVISDTTKDLTRDTNLDKNTTSPKNVEIHFD